MCNWGTQTVPVLPGSMNGKEDGKERRPMEYMCVEHEHNKKLYTHLLLTTWQYFMSTERISFLPTFFRKKIICYRYLMFSNVVKVKVKTKLLQLSIP